jgi:hypothetical protein
MVGMGTLAISAGLWTLIGTSVASIVFVLVPGVVLAMYVLERWIDDDESYAHVVAWAEQHKRR